MKVHYRGPLDRVAIPLPNGREVEVSKGKDIDLAEHLTAEEANRLGRGLLEQEDSWSLADESAGDEPTTQKKGK